MLHRHDRDTTTRTLAVVDDTLARSASRAEQGLAVLRLVVALAFFANLLRLVVVGDRPSWVLWCNTPAFTVLFALSIYELVTLRHRIASRRWLRFAVVVEAVASMWTILPAVLDPPPDWHGLLRFPDYTMLLVILVASGIRLDTRTVFLSSLATGASSLALLALDPLPVEPNALATTILTFATATGLGWTFAWRTRKVALRGAHKAAEAERTRQRLGAYVSEEIAAQVLSDGAPVLGGERHDVAVLFSDLRGFTSYAESLPPERLVTELNAYLEAMVATVHAHGGVVDKYVGDSIMVVYGVPATRGDDAARAIRTAAAMEESLARHNAERTAKGLPALKQGIGVHYGPAVVGNIGTQERLQYTVIGDTVNVASRLQTATKERQVAVLVSRDAAEAAGAAAPTLVPAGELQLRGRERPIAVFTLGSAAAKVA